MYDDPDLEIPVHYRYRGHRFRGLNNFRVNVEQMLLIKSSKTFTSLRLFSTFNVKYDVAATEEPTVKAARPSHPPSVATHGKPLKGINFYKTKSDPIAKPDEEYPDWLWTLLDPKVAPTDIFSREYQRKINKDSIKAKNFLKKR